VDSETESAKSINESTAPSESSAGGENGSITNGNAANGSATNGTDTDTEDASLVLYYFGKSQGGTAAANVERWASQMQQADGTKAKITEESFTANELKVTTVDGAGTYVAETAPGSGQFLNKPGYRLRAAVIETPNGSYYVKLVGPEKTVTHWNESFVAYLKSFEFK